MGEVSTIGLDIAKSVFQIHGVGAGGAVVIRKRISRAKLLEFCASLPACLVGIEACPTAHYSGTWPHGEADAAELRKSVSEAQWQCCSRSSLTSTMIAFQRLRGSASTSLLANMQLSGQRS